MFLLCLPGWNTQTPSNLGKSSFSPAMPNLLRQYCHSRAACKRASWQTSGPAGECEAGPREFRTAPLWGLGQRIFFLLNFLRSL